MCVVCCVLELGSVSKAKPSLDLGGGNLGWDHQAGGCGFGGRGFDTRGCFLFRLPSSRFSGCCGFGLRLLRPGCLPGGGHFSLLGRLRDRLRRGIWIRGLSGGLDTPPWTTWFQPLPRSICSAEGLAR